MISSPEIDVVYRFELECQKTRPSKSGVLSLETEDFCHGTHQLHSFQSPNERHVDIRQRAATNLMKTCVRETWRWTSSSVTIHVRSW